LSSCCTHKDEKGKGTADDVSILWIPKGFETDVLEKCSIMIVDPNSSSHADNDQLFHKIDRMNFTVIPHVQSLPQPVSQPPEERLNQMTHVFGVLCCEMRCERKQAKERQKERQTFGAQPSLSMS